MTIQTNTTQDKAKQLIKKTFVEYKKENYKLFNVITLNDQIKEILFVSLSSKNKIKIICL